MSAYTDTLAEALPPVAAATLPHVDAALNYLAQPDHFGALLDECAEIRSRLERADRLMRGEQLLYRYALKAVGRPGAPDGWPNHFDRRTSLLLRHLARGRQQRLDFLE